MDISNLIEADKARIIFENCIKLGLVILLSLTLTMLIILVLCLYANLTPTEFLREVFKPKKRNKKQKHHFRKNLKKKG